MRTFKIAVYHNLPDGGARKAIENIISGLEDRGHIIDIYTGEKFNPLGLGKNHSIDKILLPINLWRYKRFSQRLASEINKKDYDVGLITNSRILQHPYILRYIKFPKLLISQEPLRSVYERNFQKNYVYKKYYKGIIRKFIFLYSFFDNLVRKKPDERNLASADKLIVNSYFSKERFLSAYGILGKVIYLGVDTKIFKPSFENKTESHILSIGIYHIVKAHDLVIKAISLLPEDKRPFLTILGFGNSAVSEKEFQHLTKLRDDLGLQEKVKFEKSFLGDSIIDYYQKSYLTIAAHFLEPFGFTPIESMACGTPVVAVKEGGFRETVKHKETGLLVERDPKKLADAILYLLENKEIREKFSENGVSWVKSNFCWETTITKIEEEFLALMKK
ncbi:glycosyltransferase family 4 protein [Patescibacteria group bacterium]|nr:glycosyltransferase family 4 protein [Patescibacteria group bacterium]MBU4023303.1 glycosyltransferase family 4 protein [Patescibacteria group bacterium]MBU4078152.1 glycosyltransferase family 4 protein [Patescibacteria group bacterium]